MSDLAIDARALCKSFGPKVVLREFDLEVLPPSLEDLYRHHMSPAPAGATPCP